MLASSCNPYDLQVVREGYGAPMLDRQRTLPAALGRDGVGIVRETGAANMRFLPGDKVVCAYHPLVNAGAGAHQSVCDVASHGAVATINKSGRSRLSDEQWAGVPYVSLTAMSALAPLRRRHTRSRPQVFVQSGGSGVGEFAAQYAARVLHADVVCTASERHHERLRSLADPSTSSIEVHPREALPTLREAFAGRFDLVLHDTGSPHDLAPLLSTHKSAIVVSVSPPLLGEISRRGLLGGALAAAERFFTDTVTMQLPLTWAFFPWCRQAALLEDVVARYEDGTLEPPRVDRVFDTLDQAWSAYEYYEERDAASTGKVIVRH